MWWGVGVAAVAEGVGGRVTSVAGAQERWVGVARLGTQPGMALVAGRR